MLRCADCGVRLDLNTMNVYFMKYDMLMDEHQRPTKCYGVRYKVLINIMKLD